MKQLLLYFFTGFFFSLAAFAQNSFTANQKVEVQWKGRWYKATILEVKNKAYKIHYDGYASSWDETVPVDRIRSPSTESKTGTPKIKYGKYGCTATKYVNRFYEYRPKGSFVLAKNGTYTYYGFEKPCTGTFNVNASGAISFEGGYFNGGEATPMEDRENRYYVGFPAIPDNRWTCSRVSEK